MRGSIYCAGTNCSKKETCRFHQPLNKNEGYQKVDFSDTGFFKEWTDAEGNLLKINRYNCGDRSNSEYKFYQPTEG